MRIQSSIILSITIIISVFIYLVSTNSVFADCLGTFSGSSVEFLTNCAGTQDRLDPSKDIEETVVIISKTLIGFGALFAIGAIVFSGIQYTTSYGDDEKIKKAKTTGIYAIIGLVLLLTAFSLVNMIVSFIYTIPTT